MDLPIKIRVNLQVPTESKFRNPYHDLELERQETVGEAAYYRLEV